MTSFADCIIFAIRMRYCIGHNELSFVILSLRRPIKKKNKYKYMIKERDTEREHIGYYTIAHFYSTL